MKMVYMDNAAATPVRSEVIEAMLPYFDEHFGNPSTVYDMGSRIMEIIDAHVHVGRIHLPMEEVQNLLDKAGADRAVIFADPESSDIPGDNRYVLEVTQTTDHIPFIYIGGNAYSTNRPFPRLPEPEALEPYRGIKWHCWFTPGHDFGGAYLGMDEGQVHDSLTEPGMSALMDNGMKCLI